MSSIRLTIAICCLLQLSVPGLTQPAGQPEQQRQAMLQWPDFSQGITPSMWLWEATDKAFAASDAFVEAHFTAQDSKERPLLVGLGRWRALRDLGRVREDWKYLADTSQARDRWVDEWQNPKALLDPTATLSQSATKTVGLLRMLDAHQDRLAAHRLRFARLGSRLAVLRIPPARQQLPRLPLLAATSMCRTLDRNRNDTGLG